MSCRIINNEYLLTGSNGFLGQYLSNFLAEKGYSVLAHTRKAQTFDHPNISNINFDLNDKLDHIDLSKLKLLFTVQVRRMSCVDFCCLHET